MYAFAYRGLAAQRTHGGQGPVQLGKFSGEHTQLRFAKTFAEILVVGILF